MTMPAVRFFDASAMEWTRHERFPEIEIKVLEGRVTHPAASIMFVRVGVQDVIETHEHAVETETAMVLARRAQVAYRDELALPTTGMGVTIPPGTPHSLRNIGAVTWKMIAIHTPPAR